MDIQELSTQLQRFAEANGLQMDVQAALNQMDAGDFVEISQAIDNSDNRSIMHILQKYRAVTNENYKYFEGTKLIESESVQFFNDMGVDELVENYRSFVKGATYDHSHLTLSQMRTLVMEDLTTSLGAISNNDNQNQTTMNPQAQAKLKQAELQKQAGNPNFNVTVPNGTGDSIEPVVGVDIGSSPEKSLVVTKDPSQTNQLQVFGLNDVEPVQEDSMDLLDMAVQGADDSLKDNVDEECVDPSLAHEPEMQDNPEVEIIQIDGDEMNDSVPDLQPSTDEILAQIMDFCSRLNGLK